MISYFNSNFAYGSLLMFSGFIILLIVCDRYINRSKDSSNKIALIYNMQ